MLCSSWSRITRRVKTGSPSLKFSTWYLTSLLQSSYRSTLILIWDFRGSNKEKNLAVCPPSFATIGQTPVLLVLGLWLSNLLPHSWTTSKMNLSPPLECFACICLPNFFSFNNMLETRVYVCVCLNMIWIFYDMFYINAILDRSVLLILKLNMFLASSNGTHIITIFFIQIIGSHASIMVYTNHTQSSCS